MSNRFDWFKKIRMALLKNVFFHRSSAGRHFHVLGSLVQIFDDNDDDDGGGGGDDGGGAGGGDGDSEEEEEEEEEEKEEEDED